MNLSVDLGAGFRLANPVLTASGTFGYGSEFADFMDLDRLGGFIVKGTTSGAARGQRRPAHGRDPVGHD